MVSATRRLLLLASALLATAACSTGGEAPGLSPRSAGYVSAERHRTAMTTRVSLSLPLESSEPAVDKDRLLSEGPAGPDIAGRRDGMGGGSGVKKRPRGGAQAQV